MSKGHKHLKSEKAKIKLKSEMNHLPKNLNITNTSFKTKKIVIREQLKHHDETEVLSTRKLNVKDLLMRLRHHNGTVRKDALNELKEMLMHHPPKTLHLNLGSLLCEIAALSLDKEKHVRKDFLCALHSILECITREQSIPHLRVLTSYLNCAMTHINPCIKKDSLHYLDILLHHYGNTLVKNNYNILSNFLDMICMYSDNKHSRQLTTIMDHKSTNIKYRIQILKRLAIVLHCFLSDQEPDRTTYSSVISPEVEYTAYLPLYNYNYKWLSRNEIDFDDNVDLSTKTGETLRMEFVKYINTLMPLILDMWLEVCPDKKLENCTEITISSETSTFLKYAIKIIQSIIEYIETLDHNDYDYKHIKLSFINQFHQLYMRNFLSKFPYIKMREFTNKSRKYQEDYSEMESNSESCLEQNLGLCQIHIWFTSLTNDNKKKFDKTTKNYCLSVIKYINDTIENWCINDILTLSQLTKLLRTLFLSASSIWYANGIDLGQTLQLLIKVSSHLPKNDLQSDLSLIIGNIILECNLNELRREEAFEKYITTLPGLLLRPSINEATICMISQVVLRFKQWIQKELKKKHKAIIENAQKIDIIGSHDDKKSRLMICNLFYFLNAEIYY